jgi:hypothetical protein
MGRKIYITESQMKSFSRLILKENTQLNYIDNFIGNIDPTIDYITIGDGNGEIGIIFDNGNNEEISIYINFSFDYTYEGKYRSATHLDPPEYPEFILKYIEPTDVSFYIYTNEMEQEMENIRLSPNSTYYTISKKLLDDYHNEIYEKIMDSDNVMSYDDYMDDLKERSLGI